MSDASTISPPGPSAPSPTDVPTVADLDDLLVRLGLVSLPDTTDTTASDADTASETTLIDTLAVLERLERAAAAARARVTEHLVRVRTAREAAQGVPAARRCRGLAAEVALALRASPHRGAREVGLAKALVREMPRTLHALARGDISAWSATGVVRETAVLSVEHRRQVDRELADELPRLGERQAAARARAAAYRLDPGSALRRTRGARSDRHVSLRPAPDTMTYLTGFLPVEQGVACLAALRQAAEVARAAGDTRSRGQVMADTLVERVTGQARADAVPVEVHLVMTDTTLLSDDGTPGHVVGYGPVHAGLARRIVADAARVWLRRLFTRPHSRELVATDARGRDFSGELRDLLVVRDQVCRTPWCDAPVRHADHTVPAARGGETSLHNGQGLCEACNYAKEAPGWSAVPLPDVGEPHQVLVGTPTGHTHVSTAPDPPFRSEPPPEHDYESRGVHVYTHFWSPEDELRMLLA